jgi:C-3',4' desaturase CrtD
MIVVIGAGLGGLTAAGLLVRAGLPVRVLEAHVYPGGSAGTFYHQGYRFEAGATLAGGFARGGPHARVAEMLDLEWPVTPVDPAWVTHFPDGLVTQWANAEAWRVERERAFPGSEGFWRVQERLARLAWEASRRSLPWPPQSAHEWADLARAARPAYAAALPFVTRTVADLIPPGQPGLRAFLDAQLIISAQVEAAGANALYGSAALDLPRRGVNHVRGGIGQLAWTLARWIRAHGGEITFRERVTAIGVRGGRAAVVRTAKGNEFPCEAVVANVTPQALRQLLGDHAPRALRQEAARRAPGWGAFTLYLGLDASRLPCGADHHQIVSDPRQPLGEGNSVFVSLSPADEAGRAPAGHRAATLSTHTAVGPWWAAREASPAAYEERKAEYAERLLAAAERALPGLRAAVRLALPGTPITFERFTRRPGGMVGGFPQTSLLTARGPGTGLPNVWLTGDSVFPGQSTAGVTLSGMRVARAVERRAGGARAAQARPMPRRRVVDEAR